MAAEGANTSSSDAWAAFVANTKGTRMLAKHADAKLKRFTDGAIATSPYVYNNLI